VLWQHLAASYNGHIFFGASDEFPPEAILAPAGPFKARPLEAGLIKIKAKAAKTSEMGD
jgi:hypothetical protein